MVCVYVSIVTSRQLHAKNQHPSRLMSPLKRYNKVFPSPQKKHGQTPRKADNGQMCKPFSLQSSSESSLLEEKENGGQHRIHRPGSAPLYEDQRPKSKTSSPPKLVSARMVEVHGQATNAGKIIKIPMSLGMIAVF